jgi:hypothetical protein
MIWRTSAPARFVAVCSNVGRWLGAIGGEDCVVLFRPYGSRGLADVGELTMPSLLEKVVSRRLKPRQLGKE